MVDYTVTGTVSAADYTDGGAGKLTIAATQATGLITIGVAGDDIDEVPETLIVTLTKIATDAGTAAIGTPNSVTTTVLPATTNTVSFAATSVSAAEDAPLVFTANLTATVDVAVHYDITPGTASRTDYDSASGTFSISSGSPGSGSFTITPVNDNLAEDAETFTARLRLVSPPANVVLGFATATGTIADNDPIAATVTANQTTVVEGSDATFTVDLGNPGSEDVVVTYNTDPNTTDTEPDADSNDFEAPEGTLTIPAGQTMGTITITTSPDDLIEVVEELRVTLDDAESGAGTVAVTTTAADATATTGIGDPESTILVSVDDAITTEGEDAIVIVRLSGKSSGVVTVPFDVGGGTATSGGTDYTDPNEDVVIPAGMTTGTITVSTEKDQIAEDTETFTVTLTTLTDPPTGVSLGDETATVTIRDDNPLTVTVGSAGQVREGDVATFTVNLNGGMGITPITVDYTVGGTATEGIDYDEPAGTLTINPAPDNLSEVSATIPIQTRQDSEADESLVVTLTGVRTETGRVTLGTPRVARTTLVAQETVIITVGDALVEEGNSAIFAITVSGEGTGAAKLRYETAPGTATAADFTAASGTQDINTVDPIAVVITNDSLAEGEETFALNLSLENPPDNVVLAAASAKATISDDAADALSVSVDDEEESVEEGSDASFLVNVGGGTSTADVVVKYMIAGGETNPAAKEDYEVPGDSVTIPAGTNTATITIPIVADDLLEPNEELQVTLTSASTAKGVVTLDADVANRSATTDIIPKAQDAVTVSLAKTAVTVTEGGKALFPVVLSGKVAQDLTFRYAITAPTTDGAAEGDYSTASEVEIKEGETRAVIEVNTTPDTTAENTETFTLTLALPTDPPAGLAPGTAVATGTITDNDPINVTVVGPDRVVAGSTGNDYRFRLSGDTTASAAITVAYSVTNGEPASGTVDIPVNGSVSADAPVTAGASGSLVVRVTDVTTAAGRVASGVGRSKSTQIRPAGTVIVSIGNAADVDEDTSSPSASFDVSYAGSPTGSLTVQYQVVAGSASTADFGTPSPRPLVFTGTGTIAVPVENDEVAEGDETFSVRLTGARDENGAVELGTTTGTAKIDASDELTARVTSQDATVLEGESATFVVDLGGTSSTNVAIDYTVAGATVTNRADVAADEEDFTPEKGTLMIPAGRRTGTIQIEAVDDDILEPNEGLQVTLSNPTPSNFFTEAGVGDPAQTVIGASDSPARVSVADVTVDEGETAMIEVKLSKKVSSNVEFSYSLTSGDYTHTPANLTFMPGETTQTIMVDTTPDQLAEDDETFTVTLALVNPPIGVSLGRSVATVTMTDDALTAKLTGPPSVEEGDPAVYEVKLTGSSGDEDLNVEFSTEGSTATAGQDFSPASGSITIPAGETSGSFTIQIAEDEIVDLRETVVVTATAETASGDTVKTESKVTRIDDDDGTLQVSVAADQEVVPEGRDATFTVTLAGTIEEELEFTYSTGPSGDYPATSQDYTAPSDATLTIAAQETSATITVAVIDDDEEEQDEKFTVTLSAASLPDGVEIETATATVTITDHTLESSVSAPATVNEGQSVPFTVSLTPAGQNRSGFAVDYNLGGTAVAPGDYTGASSGTLTIPAGQDSGAITLTTEDDRVLDPGETLSVTLSNPRTLDGGLAALGSPATATVEIVDQQTVTWSVEDISFPESLDAVFTVMFDQGGLVQDAVTLTYETIVGGTADPGVDYTAVSNGRVTIPGGSPSATFTVQVTDDSIGEPAETFMVRLTLSSAAPDGVGPPSGTAQATIEDDDLALLPIAPVTVAEGSEATIALALDRATTEPVTLSYQTVDGSATFRDDYLILLGTTPIPPSGAVPLPEGSQAGAVTVRAVDDSLAESSETFTIRVMLSNGGSPQEATVTITDNDTLRVSVTGPETVAEGDVARFIVKVGGGP